MRARKKPVEVEVWKFTKESLKSPDSWVRKYTKELSLISQYGGDLVTIEIETLEGTMTAQEGDYIIKGVNGELYPCKPDIFRKTYDIVEERGNG